MDFCMNAISSQLLVNMDPDIFNDFDFIPIILDVFFYEGVTISHKESMYEIIQVYLDKITKDKNLKSELMEDYLNKTLLYSDLTRKED